VLRRPLPLFVSTAGPADAAISDIVAKQCPNP
jgi:hypothetical protein